MFPIPKIDGKGGKSHHCRFVEKRVVKVGPLFLGHGVLFFLHSGQIVDLVIHMTNLDPCDL